MPPFTRKPGSDPSAEPGRPSGLGSQALLGIAELERNDRKRVALFTLLISALFPLVFFLADIAKNRTPLYLNYSTSIAVLLFTAVLVAKTGPTRLVIALLLFNLYEGFVLAVVLPEGHGVFLVIFFCFVPFMYLMGGAKIGRGAAVGLAGIALALAAAKLSGLVPAWQIRVGYGAVGMAFVTLVFLIAISEANERRHARNMDWIVRRHYFDEDSGLANGNALAEERLDAGSSLLVVRIQNFEELRGLLEDQGGRDTADKAATMLKNVFTGAGPALHDPYRLSATDFALRLPAEFDPSVAAARVLDAAARESLAAGSPLRFAVRLGSFRSCRASCPARFAMDEAATALADAAASGASIAHRQDSGDQAPLSEIGRKAPVLLRNIQEGTIKAVFQPVYDVSSDGIGFLEALIRLENGGAYVSPDAYLGVSVRLGLDSRISDFILGEALDAAKRTGHSVSLNVSYRDLERPSFLDRLLASCAELHARDNSLIVELTEHEVFSDFSRVREFVALVHEAGGLVFLDDFGSGYSNYASLIGARFDAVKVAGEIVREIAVREEAAALYGGIAAFCGSAGIELIAEHVSDEAILSRALDGGARFLQGFLFSEAVPLERLGELRFPGERGSEPRPISAGRFGSPASFGPAVSFAFGAARDGGTGLGEPSDREP
ncbi:MAG: EAL domain-containing protein [Treponema sp.]|nr:EAL domain-containing protein [Treponema sp.]